MLLGGDGLTEANLLAHLGVIEQRSNELLQVCLCTVYSNKTTSKGMVSAVCKDRVLPLA